MYLYSLRTRKTRKYIGVDLEEKDPDNIQSMSLFINKRLFLIGGDPGYTFEITLNKADNSAALVKKANPSQTKLNIKLIGFQDRFIFAISNSDTNCEYYNAKWNVWKEMPKPEKYQSPALCIMGQEWLYQFCGEDSNLIQRLNLISLIDGQETIWENIELASGPSLPTCYGLEASMINSHEAIIFGGGTEDKKESSLKSCLLLNLISKTTTALPEMVMGGMFHGRRSSKYGNRVYSIGQFDNSLHILNLIDNKWECVPFSTWTTEQQTLINIII